MTARDPLPGPDDHPVAGRYALGPVIGVGSSAVVRRGRDLQDGEPVAVKLFRPGASVHDRRQLEQELTTLATLEHPGLIALHDGGTEGDRPFVITDLVEGPTLAERIQQGPLPADRVRALGAQLADALAHVHAKGFVHRDIKPANVLLEDGQRPRLADFGISRALECTSVTTEGCVLGTAAYLAPEQVRGEVVGPPADVYALGLLLLEAVTGQREYPGSAVESATARLFRPPAVPDELPPSVRAAAGRDDRGRPGRATDRRRGGHRAGPPPGGRPGRRRRWLDRAPPAPASGRRRPPAGRPAAGRGHPAAGGRDRCDVHPAGLAAAGPPPGLPAGGEDQPLVTAPPAAAPGGMAG